MVSTGKQKVKPENASSDSMALPTLRPAEGSFTAPDGHSSSYLVPGVLTPPSYGLCQSSSELLHSTPKNKKGGSGGCTQLGGGKKGRGGGGDPVQPAKTNPFMNWKHGKQGRLACKGQVPIIPFTCPEADWCRAASLGPSASWLRPS